MKSGSLVLLALLAPLSVSAEEVQYRGHGLEVDASQEARPVLRMSGTRHAINLSAQQLAQKARTCLASRDGVVVEPQDAAGDAPFTAWVRVDSGSIFSSRSLRSRWTLDAGDGYFRIVQSDFGFAQAAGGEAVTSDYLPLVQDGMPWKNALDALFPLEDALADCLYR